MEEGQQPQAVAGGRQRPPAVRGAGLLRGGAGGREGDGAREEAGGGEGRAQVRGDPRGRGGGSGGGCGEGRQVRAPFGEGARGCVAPGGGAQGGVRAGEEERPLRDAAAGEDIGYVQVGSGRAFCGLVFGTGNAMSNQAE